MKDRQAYQWLSSMVLVMFGLLGISYHLLVISTSTGYPEATNESYSSVPGSLCNVTAFNQLLDLDAIPPRVPRELLAGCHRVFYNRVPKCASRTVHSLFDRQAAARNFTSLFIDRKWVLTKREKEKFYLPSMRANDKFTLTSHFLFYDFHKYYPDTCSFVNVIRDPVTKFESTFYWSKYGSVEDPHSQENHNYTIEECLAKYKCRSPLQLGFGAIRFLCGPSMICRNGSEEEAALQLAIRNIERSYIAVGLYEDLPSFLEILEYLMPHMFSGLLNNYAAYGPEEKHNTRTIQKENVTTQTRQQMKQLFEREYRFYNYTKTRMYKLLHAVRYLKQHGL